MRKECFPEQRKSKLMPRGDSPCQVIRRTNNNSYQLDLPGEYNISATFNVADLSPYFADSDLTTNPFEEEENDAGNVGDVQHSAMIEAPEGPITRARAKRFKEHLNLFMKYFFNNQNHTQESKSMCVQVIQALEDQVASETSN